MGRFRRLCGAALVAMGGLAALALGSGAAAPGNGLTFKATDGSTIHFNGTPKVQCGRWEPGIGPETIQIELRTRSQAWEIRAVLASVEGGKKLKVPMEVFSNHPKGALFFVYRKAPLIEASTSAEGGSGYLSFSKASCEPGAEISFTIHARLGSEISEGTEVHVVGAFDGTISGR